MITKIIAASGGDYSSLVSWEAARPATLTDAETAECRDFSLSENLTIAGITTSSSNYLRIYAPPAYRHDGRSRAVGGVGFRLTSSSGLTLNIAVNHVRLEGVEIEGTGSAQAISYVFGAFSSGGNDHRIDQCIIHDVITGSGYTINAAVGNLNLSVRNSIMYGFQRSWDTRGATSVTSENNTFWRHQAQLGLVSGSELVCKNTYSGHTGGASDDYWSGGSPSGNNNASSDTSATARFTSSINSVSSAVFTSTTSGAEDFTLVSGSNALVDAGATLASVTSDLKGTSRPQGSSYDIGAIERVSAGGAASYSYSPSGGIVYSGTSIFTKGKTSVGSGGIIVTGTSPKAQGVARTASGGLSISGVASVIVGGVQQRIVVPVGGLIVSGVAATVRMTSRLASGGIGLGGQAMAVFPGLADVFGTINDVVWQKLKQLGGSGTRNDMLDENEYWRGEAGGSDKPLNDVKADVLKAHGYEGATNDMEKKYWEEL